MCEKCDLKSSMVQNAITKGFEVLTSNDDDAEKAKKQFNERLLENKEYRDIVFAMLGVASGELATALEKNGISAEPPNWNKMSDEDRKTFIRGVADKIGDPINMKTALDLVWLGMNIGLAVHKEANVLNRAETMISEVMDATRYGKGNCTFCFKRAYLMKWGPSGEPICANCAEKHPEGILSTINKMLQEKFGDDAPIAIAGGVAKAGDVNSKIQEAIRNARETDISKFN